ALGAFAAQGRGTEASEAILDIAIANVRHSSLMEGVLGVFGVLHDKHWTGHAIPPEVWLPVLVERLKQDSQKWQPLASSLLGELRKTYQSGVGSSELRKLLIEFATDPAVGPSYPALALLQQPDHEMPLEDEVVRLMRRSLTDHDMNNALNALRILNFRRLESLPEQFDVLMHDDPKVRQEARTFLPNVSANDRAAVIERLWDIVENPERKNDHRDALRALGVLVRQFGYGAGEPGGWTESELYRRSIKRLEQLIREGPKDLVPAAIVAYGISAEGIDEWLKDTAEPTDLKERVKQSRGKIEAEERRVFGDRDLGMGGGMEGSPGGGKF
ncbi:MAG TPA: hypothetical protein VF175_16980, partial [Lacipirellula sp.]